MSDTLVLIVAGALITAAVLYAAFEAFMFLYFYSWRRSLKEWWEK
jgi:hypothetical protein